MQISLEEITTEDNLRDAQSVQYDLEEMPIIIKAKKVYEGRKQRQLDCQSGSYPQDKSWMVSMFIEKSGKGHITFGFECVTHHKTMAGIMLTERFNQILDELNDKLIG